MTTTTIATSSRRRSFGSLGVLEPRAVLQPFAVRELLVAPFVLAFAFSSPSLAQDAELAEECAPGQRHVVYIDDVPQPRCEILFGDADVRGDNESWRTERIMAVESGTVTLDVIHTDAQLKRPRPRTLAGMGVVETFVASVAEEECEADSDEYIDDLDGGTLEEGDGGDDLSAESSEPAALEHESREVVARIDLSDRWASLCGQSSLILRVDDAIGAGGRVLHIDRRGVLAHLGGELVWLGKLGASVPAFRTTWRSHFSVSTDTAGVKKPAKKKKKRRSRRKRR